MNEILAQVHGAFEGQLRPGDAYLRGQVARR